MSESFSFSYCWQEICCWLKAGEGEMGLRGSRELIVIAKCRISKHSRREEQEENVLIKAQQKTEITMFRK